MTIGEDSDDVPEEPIQSVLTRLERDHARTLATVARWVDEHGAEGLRARLEDDGIRLPPLTTLHGQFCLCTACRPDEEWGSPGRMVTN